MKTDDLIQEIQSLPVDEHARLADCVLRSLNQTLPAIDQKWAELASQRLRYIQAGKAHRCQLRMSSMKSGINSGDVCQLSP